MDGTVLVFAMLATLATGLLFGLAPVLQIRRIEPAEVLRQGQRTIASAGHPRLRQAIVVGQIALTLVLVLSAALMTRTLVSLTRVDPGYTTSGVLALDLQLPGARYASAVSQQQFYADLVARAGAVPGVDQAAATNNVPIGGGYSGVAFSIDGRPPLPSGVDQSARYRVVSADYFRTMRIPIVNGRTFAASDARIAVPLIRWFPQQPLPDGLDRPQPPPVAIVNQAMASRYWPGANPIGSHIRVLFSPSIDIVGVVADTHNESLRDRPVPEFYLHDLQEPQAAMSLIVRTSGDAGALAPALRAAVWNLDRNLAIRSVRTMDEVIDQSFGVSRLTSSVLGGFAIIALGLMSAGVYGLMAFTTRQRLPEIGVRLALGADRRQIGRMVIRQAVWLATVGIGAGVALAAGLGRIIRGEFLGARTIDPMTVGVVVVVAAGRHQSGVLVARATGIPRRSGDVLRRTRPGAPIPGGSSETRIDLDISTPPQFPELFSGKFTATPSQTVSYFV